MGKCGGLANGCFLLSLEQGGTGGLRVQIFLYFSCEIINPLTGNAPHCAILIHFFTCLMLDDFLINGEALPLNGSVAFTFWLKFLKTSN